MFTHARRAAALLLPAFALAALGLAVAAPAPEVGEEVLKDRADFIPQGKYQPVPGKAVGVLVSDVAKVMGNEGRSGAPDNVAFSSGGGSYRWVYVPARDKPQISGLQVRTGEKGDQVKIYPGLNMANPVTLKDLWGVTATYALAEVEVNDGLGAPADQGFVATNVKLLDGSKDYPLKVADTIDTLRKKQEGYWKNRQKDLDDAMAKAQKDALKDKKPTGPRETSELMHVSWLPDKERLRVRFFTRVTDGAYQNGGGGANPVDPLPPGKGGLRPPPPRFEGGRWGTSFGVEYGVSYEVGKNGSVERFQVLPPEGFAKEIPPPPAAGGPRGGIDPVPLPPAPPADR
jgi:hypothetical protein